MNGIVDFLLKEEARIPSLARGASLIMDKISPEEKLLRLIRGQKKQGVSIPLKAAPVKISSVAVTIILAASLIYTVGSFLYPVFGLRKTRLPKIANLKTPETNPELETKPMSLEFYLEGVKNRQIFAGGLPAQELNQPAGAGNPELLKNITLIGIISGDNAQAVIEDKRIQKIFYLIKGQFIADFKLEDIQEGKVILNYKGQKYELYL